MNWEKIKQKKHVYQRFQIIENLESEYTDELEHMDMPNVFESQHYSNIIFQTIFLKCFKTIQA